MIQSQSANFTKENDLLICIDYSLSSEGAHCTSGIINFDTLRLVAQKRSVRVCEKNVVT